ncbi:peptide-methionine (S)-S-oxide reductase MsrA [Haladaptatus sp. NG-WS-4]
MTEQATLAGGCFWCLEAAFEELEGVESVTSGYAGGSVEYPSYEEVCSGSTGHAEVVQLTYDPQTVDYDDLLQVFFTIHDPTTLNRQGPDVGSQYRSAIFYHDDDQKASAERFIDELEAADAFDDPIVTEVEPLEAFYEASEYHQNYYKKNPNDAYCTVNAQPKIRKVREKFAEKVRQ